MYIRCKYKTALIVLLLSAVCAWSSEWKFDDGLIIEGDIVTMNETMDVIENGRLVIMGRKIAAVLRSGQALPDDLDLQRAKTVTIEGWIFPGLIDSHNHVEYNVLPLYDVPRQYTNRYQWSGTTPYKHYVNYPKKLLTGGNYYDLRAEVLKYAEVKAIIGGVTAIQGSPDLRSTRLLVRNIEHRNFDQDRIYQRGLAITDTRWQVTLEDGLLRLMEDGKVDAWLVHLAEGTDDASRHEFDVLKNLGLLGDMTVAIHSTALTRDDFHEMAAAGTKVIWSPLSNLLLYGQTTDIPAALQEDVHVSLGADWSPSGCKNLLGELKIADQIDRIRFGDVITDGALIQMVTTNPAFALGLDDKIGQLEAGYYADIAVFSKVNPSPYRSLIDCNERHVELVVIGGEPLYGDLAVMSVLKPDDYEVLMAADVEKAIDVTAPDVPKGDQTFAEITQLLEQAMLFDREHMWETFGGAMSMDEFQTYLDDKFPAGIVPIRLDPLYPFDDEFFFGGLTNSTIANLSFDVASFWQVPEIEDPWLAVLSFVNKAATTFYVLDIETGLDRRAARNIVTHRDGTDSQFGTADDDPFDDVPELDDIPYVGRSALEKLFNFAFGQDQTGNQILEFLNDAATTFEILDRDVGLDSRAAGNIISHRDGPDGIRGTSDDNPFDSMAELDRVGFVGPSAIEKIRNYVLNE